MVWVWSNGGRMCVKSHDILVLGQWLASGVVFGYGSSLLPHMVFMVIMAPPE